MASVTLPHDDALAAFVERVEDTTIPGLSRLIVFGSVARSEQTADSDIDILAVVEDQSTEAAVEDRLRDIAYDVMLGHEAVFSIHGVTESVLRTRSDHPFFKRALTDGTVIYG